MPEQLKEPCATCPYRRETRLALWSIAEFLNLEKHDQDPLMGNTFACHGDAKLPEGQRHMCAGWLLDQRRRGTPSIRLRIFLAKNPDAVRAYAELQDDPQKFYASIAEMFEANYPSRKDRPPQPIKK